MSNDYCGMCLPSAVTEKLQAGAFQNLCQHLRDRSDAVPNMDLMTVSGFCRNCLAKVRAIYAPFAVSRLL